MMIKIVRKRLSVCLLTAGLLASSIVTAQDMAITNARIIVGNGEVIESGTVIVRDGQIASVAAGSSNTGGLDVIDANGMTAMAGFIDAHRHINTGPDEAAEMQALLEAGYTTIMSGGGPGDGNLILKDHIDSGLINGPRIIPTERIRLENNTPENARAQIRAMAAMGIEYTGEIALTPTPGPSEGELEILRAILDEAEKEGVKVQVHAVSTAAMVAAIDAGVKLLVHLPNKDWVDRDAARKLADSGAMILATIGFGAPLFGVYADDNEPRVRDGNPWPYEIPGGEPLANGDIVGVEAAYAIINARTIWDEGGILGYCTDTRYDPTAGLEHELRSYNVAFSMLDIVHLMGVNTAKYIEMEDQLGTLEAGKLADIVLLDGNPLEGYWHMLKTEVVLKGGVVVVDKR